MRFALVHTLLLGATVTTAAPTNDANAILTDLQNQVNAKLNEASEGTQASRPGAGGSTAPRCTLANAAIRRDWYAADPAVPSFWLFASRPHNCAPSPPQDTLAAH